jgi:hypothetical protein
MLDKNKSKYIEIRKSKSGSTYKVFHFNCSECGNDIKAQSNQLLRHSGKCMNCSHKGIPYLHIYNELKNHGNKNVNFTLTFDEFLEIIKLSKCHYCNTELNYNKHSRVNGIATSRAYQLDRKNNLEGYTLNNVVTCCWECNRLKSDRFTYDEFLLLSPILKQIMINRNNDKNRSKF